MTEGTIYSDKDIMKHTEHGYVMIPNVFAELQLRIQDFDAFYWKGNDFFYGDKLIAKNWFKPNKTTYGDLKKTMLTILSKYIKTESDYKSTDEVTDEKIGAKMVRDIYNQLKIDPRSIVGFYWEGTNLMYNALMPKPKVVSRNWFTKRKTYEDLKNDIIKTIKIKY